MRNQHIEVCTFFVLPGLKLKLVSCYICGACFLAPCEEFEKNRMFHELVLFVDMCGYMCKPLKAILTQQHAMLSC